MPTLGQTAAVAQACANCGTGLAGEYCHACGQHAIGEDDLTVRGAARTLSDDILHLESKTLRTIAQLVKPGALTAAYLGGRRAPYTSPLKLYLACAAIFFLCAPYAGFTLEQIVAGDSAGQLSRLVEAQRLAKGLDPALFAERFNIRFQSVYTSLLFVSMLAGAAMLALLFRRQRRPFGAHVLFELHYVSFLYLLSIALGIAMRITSGNQLTGVISTVGVLSIYMFVALRRVYGEGPGRTLAKTAAMIVFAFFFDNLINFVALVLTLRLV